MTANSFAGAPSTRAERWAEANWPLVEAHVLRLQMRMVAAVVPKRGSLVNVIRYADDFVITGINPKILKDKVMPAVVAFLRERGLELPEDTTEIVNA